MINTGIPRPKVALSNKLLFQHRFSLVVAKIFWIHHRFSKLIWEKLRILFAMAPSMKFRLTGREKALRASTVHFQISLECLTIPFESLQRSGYYTWL